MSDPNDKLLDEYLTRDSAVSQHYRKLDATDVPPQLDAAVLAQARAAVAPAQRHPSRWRTWAAPVALAASMVFAVTIVLETGLDDEVRLPEVKNELPSPAPITSERAVAELTESMAIQPQFAPPPVEPAMHDAPSDVAESMMREQLVDEREQQARKQSANATAEAAVRSATASRRPAADASALDTSLETTPPAQAERFTTLADATQRGEVVERNARLRKSETEVPMTSAAPASAGRQTVTQRPVAAPPPAAEAAQAPRLSPAEWLKQIRDLRRDGKVIEADEQWREFVRAYPDFKVSERDAARPLR